MIKKIISVFPLLLCLISLMYPPYIMGDLTIKESHSSYSTILEKDRINETTDYLPPIYTRKLLFHSHWILRHGNFNFQNVELDGGDYQYPEKINLPQLACELLASITLFFLINSFLGLKIKD
jgi:hypothetical protein